MNISLPKEQLEWLEAEVAAGHFSSIDEALSLAVAELKSLHENDLAWAKPYVDEARDQVARGETLSGDEFFRWLNSRIEDCGSSAIDVSPHFHAGFRSDINSILHYLERVAGPRVADSYARRFRTTIDRLIQFPRSGAPRLTLGPNARVAVVPPYILI